MDEQILSLTLVLVNEKRGRNENGRVALKVYPFALTHLVQF